MSRALNNSRAMVAAVVTLWVMFAASGARAQSQPESLSSQTTDPTASLMALKFLTEYVGAFHGPNPAGESNDAWSLTLRPVIPFTAWEQNNILRLTIPFQIAGRGRDGLDDVSAFDLDVVQTSWGRVGAGLVTSLASHDDEPDRISAGPALAVEARPSARLKVGLFNQNFFASQTATSQVQPILDYQLTDGWSLSAGESQFIFDWNRGRWLSAPVGAEVGQVTRLLGQPVRWAVNPQYNLVDAVGSNKWSVTVTLAILVPAQ